MSTKKLVRIYIPLIVAVIGAGGVIAAAVISDSHGGSTTSRSLPPSSSPTAQACQNLVDSASKEAAALANLQNSISIATPSGHIIGHTSHFGNAYAAVRSSTQALIQAEQQYKSHGGQITADPKLGGDLIQLPIDLTNLRQAVLTNGTGGAQWNQLSNYQADFQDLAQMSCTE